MTGYSPSTVSREIKRNGGIDRYSAVEAESMAWKRAKRPKLCLLATNNKLRSIVTKKLTRNWSPEQVSQWLKLACGYDELMPGSCLSIALELLNDKTGAG